MKEIDPAATDEPIDWNMALDIIDSGNLYLLRRSIGQLEYYREWTKLVKKYFLKPDDFIKHVVFGWDIEPIDQSENSEEPVKRSNVQNITKSTSLGESIPLPPVKKLFKAIEPKFKHLKTQYILRQNDFTYYFTPDITHYILWCTREMSADEIESYIDSEFPMCSQLVWFVNTPDNKTIQSIWHAHILVKASDTVITDTKRK